MFVWSSSNSAGAGVKVAVSLLTNATTLLFTTNLITLRAIESASIMSSIATLPLNPIGLPIFLHANTPDAGAAAQIFNCPSALSDVSNQKSPSRDAYPSVLTFGSTEPVVTTPNCFHTLFYWASVS